MSLFPCVLPHQDSELSILFILPYLTGEMLLCISWCFNLPFSCDRRLNNHVVPSPPHCSPGNCLSFPYWTIHFSFTQSQRCANGDSEIFKAIQFIKRWQRCLWSVLSLTFRKATLYLQMLTYIFFANLRIKRPFKVRARRAPRGSLTREEAQPRSGEETRPGRLWGRDRHTHIHGSVSIGADARTQWW